MKIENLNVFGGNQQFADTIINSFPTIDENDRQILEIIRGNCDLPDRQIELVKLIEKLRSPDVSDAEKKKSGTILKKFFDSIVSETGKFAVKGFLSSGSELIKYIF